MDEEDEDKRYEGDMVKEGDNKLEREKIIASGGNELMLSLSDLVTEVRVWQGLERYSLSKEKYSHEIVHP